MPHFRRLRDLVLKSQLTALEQNAQAAVFVKDTEGVYRNVNRACELLWRLSREEIVGRKDEDLLPPACARQVRANDLRVMATGEPVEVVEWIDAPAGSFVFLSSKVPLRDDEGRIIGICGVAVDITELKRTEASLRESEERFRRLADGLPALVWMTGTENEGQYFNRTWLAFTGRPLVQELGDGWREGVHPEDGAALESIREAFRARLPFSTQFRLRRADGDYRWVLGTGSPRFAPDGTFQGFVGSCVDVTESLEASRRVRDSEERLRLTIEAAGVVTWDWDLASGEVVWSDNAEEILGFSPTGRAPYDLLEHVDPSGRGALRESLERARARRGDFRAEFQITTPAGAKRWIACRGRTRPAHGERAPERIAGIVVDVTDRREQEERLRAQTLQLIDSDRRKDEFLGMLAHELRNPLAPILYTAEYLRASSDPEIVESAEVVRRQVRHMARLVDDLLDVSRITRGQIRLRERGVSLREVLQRAVETVRPAIEERRQVLSTNWEVPPTDPLAVSGDEARLCQVFANLLHNASKFTPPDGAIEIVGGRRDGRPQVRVRDRGRGIPADELQRIFEPFHQVDHTIDRREGGLGLGLTLVQKLLQLHRGDVEVKSGGPGRGSEFTVTLPAAGEGDPARRAPDGPVPGAVERRVLVVDDNEDAAEGLGRILRRRGHVVEVVHDGLDALQRAHTFRPEAILLDLGLPGLDGFEVARILRRDAGIPRPMLVALTGYSRPDDRERALSSGFDHFLTKPADPDAISALIAGAAAEDDG